MPELVVRTSTVHPGRDLPAWWEPLFQDAANASVFLSPAWMRTWLANYASAFSGQWLSCWDGERCVAGCLLLSRAAKLGPVPIRLLVVNTAAEAAEESPWVEYNDMLCKAGYESLACRLLAEDLGARRWDQLFLAGFEKGGILDRLASEQLHCRRDFVAKASPYVDLSKIQAKGIDAALSANSRSQIRRSIKLYASYGEVCVDAADSISSSHAYLDDLARLHRQGWERRGIQGGFRSERFLRFHHELIDALWSASAVQILRARAGETVIGYLYNFAHAGKVYFYQSGFAYQGDPKLKPGLVAHYLAICHFATRGMNEYDFMAGDSRYKRSFANAERQLVWAWIERRNPRMWLVQAGRCIKTRIGRKARAPGPQQPAGEE